MKRWAVGVMLVMTGCEAPTDPLVVPEPSPETFETNVYPVLLADCAFHGCHGTHDRFFAVFGPGRARLDPLRLAFDPATPEELALSYTRARSMLIASDGPARAPLLRKPLAVDAGGAEHGGDDTWGNAVYATKRDPRYEALFFWATGAP